MQDKNLVLGKTKPLLALEVKRKRDESDPTPRPRAPSAHGEEKAWVKVKSSVSRVLPPMQGILSILPMVAKNIVKKCPQVSHAAFAKSGATMDCWQNFPEKRPPHQPGTPGIPKPAAPTPTPSADTTEETTGQKRQRVNV